MFAIQGGEAALIREREQREGKRWAHGAGGGCGAGWAVLAPDLFCSGIPDTSRKKKKNHLGISGISPCEGEEAPKRGAGAATHPGRLGAGSTALSGREPAGQGPHLRGRTGS